MDPVILVFAGLAAFFIFKLLSALGEGGGDADNHADSGSEMEALRRTLANGLKKRNSDSGDEARTGLNDRPGFGLDEAAQEDQTDEVIAPVRAVNPATRKLQDVDPEFDEAVFLDGAKAAYEMIVEAFARGDIKNIRSFLSDQVFQSFQSAIDVRNDASQVSEVKFIGIDKAQISDSSVTDDMLTAVTEFSSNQVRVTRGQDGEVIEGDANRIDLVRDRWTFTRKRNSGDPNWILVATGSF